MAGCDNCRSGCFGDDALTGFDVDGRFFAYCAACGRKVSDPYAWAGGDRHGIPVLLHQLERRPRFDSDPEVES